MNNPLRVKEFEKLVENKFSVYNSLFLNLPYPGVSSVGMLIPLLNKMSKQGLDAGKDPLNTLDSFFEKHTDIKSEQDKIDFMFRVIQYVERQIVLYDSVEDAAFGRLAKSSTNLPLREYMHLIDSNSKDAKKKLDKLSSFSARMVFTAHPTQFYPPSVLDIIAKLRGEINENEIYEIDKHLRQLGLTSLTNVEKPTPVDEARNVIYFLRNTYYDAVAELYSEIRQSVDKGDFDNPGILQFGFWPGGDRDGNPFVTAKITMKVADELRMELMKCYYRDIKDLLGKLTFRGVRKEVKKLRDRLYETMFDTSKILSFDEIINPLYAIRKTVEEKYTGLYLDDLDNVIDKVKIFRTHFATLDIRQHHDYHQKTVEAILTQNGVIKESVSELSKEELIDHLINKTYDVNANLIEDEVVQDTIVNIRQLQKIQAKNGVKGCDRYIISNSEDIYSVLYVFGLLRWCGWGEEPISMDIIPLFETMEGMENSKQIMSELFEIEAYRQHVAQRDETQTVMLGFSDGTKDGGYLQANWSIFKCKETLSKVCDQYDIKAIFFDGRGGPPARGGGKSHRFYASQTDRIANNAIQLTIQGQTITSKFGTKDHFKFNCEQLLTAGLKRTLSDTSVTISQENRDLIEELAQLSYNKYTALKDHKMFVPYLEHKSALKYYSAAKVGSRPTKRGAKDGLEFKDLRAIPFVGSWSQLKQNVPGYFGVGTAINTLASQGRMEDLKRLFVEVPYFRTLILNSQMALSKCNFALTSYIAENPDYHEFWHILKDEFELARKMTLKISGYDVLMEEEEIARKSIQIREQIVLPLLVIQQYALQKIEGDSDLSETYKKIVQRSLYGNINASRNSA